MVTYNVSNPSEYLNNLGQDWRRERLLDLRKLILSMAPDWVESIHYGMLGFGPPDDPALHLNAQKNYVALYLGDLSKVDPDGAWLATMDHGKTCIRFKKKDAIGAGVRDVLEKYLTLKRAGVDLGC